MTKIEKTIFNFLDKYKNVIFFTIISLIAIGIRYMNREFQSFDWEVFLNNWHRYMSENGGMAAMSKPVGDYSMAYQFVIAIMTYIPMWNLYQYKIFSCIFDFLLAIYLGKTVCIGDDRPVMSNPKFMISYATVLFLPTVYVNGGVWAQCDVIYTFFVVLFLYNFLKGQYNAAFIALGVAFAFKLQTIFILPFVFFIYFANKNFSIFKLLISLASFYACNLPGIIAGRGLAEPFRIYLLQTAEYKQMYWNYPSFWGLVTRAEEFEVWGHVAIVVAAVVLGVELYVVLAKKAEFHKLEDVLLLAAWTAFTTIIFLPNIHERYAFMLDMILLIIFFRQRNIMSFINLIIQLYISCNGTFMVMFGVDMNHHLLSSLNVFNWVLITLSMLSIMGLPLVDGVIKRDK